MTPAEANVLLTKAGMIDPRMRRVDPIEAADRAEAWAEVLEDVPLDVALEALRKHYRSSEDAIMPANVLELAGVVDVVPDTYRDIMPEILAESKARALAAAGVTATEYEEFQHDAEWLRSKFPQAVENAALTYLGSTADEHGEPE